MKYARHIKLMLIIYLAFIHILALAAITKCDFVSRVQNKFGLEKKRNELTPFFFTTLKFHERIDKNIPKDSFLIFGDSLAQGLAVSAISPRLVNFGIGQDTTFGLLTRLPHYSAIQRSKLIILAIGVNDLKWRENNTIIDNYKKIIRQIPEDIPILFNGILPIDEVASKRYGYNSRIDKLNNNLREICASMHRLYFLDISKSLMDETGNLSDTFHIGDGIHLNKSGNNIWISKLKTALPKIII